MSTNSIPTEQEVIKWMSELSNWKRWGKDDQIGALNLITPELIKQSASLVTDGVSVSCARPLDNNIDAEVYRPTQRLMLELSLIHISEPTRPY